MKEFPTKLVIELACAAYRKNGEYLKNIEYKLDENGKFLYVKHSNKDLVKNALGVFNCTYELEFQPAELSISAEDQQEAEDIKKHFRKLVFSAVKGKNDFESEVNSLLEMENIIEKKIGYISCLPYVYRKDKEKSCLTKKLKLCDNISLAEIGIKVNNKNGEIVRVSRSKNYDAWNILAIIDNKVVSWMSKVELKLGNVNIQQARIKDIWTNFQTEKVETRLNYVKALQ